MSKNLRKKLFRDIRQNLVQFFAIFVMCFLAMYIMEAFDSDHEGVCNSINEYYAVTNFMDLKLSSEGFSEQDLVAVKNLSGVKNAELRATYSGKVRIAGEEKKLEFNFIDENNISKMLLFDGEPFSRGKYGIWIDRDFAKRQNIEVGDVLQLTLGEETFSEPVKGIILNPDYIYFMIDETYTDPDIGAYGYAFLDSAEYPGERITYENIFVDVKDVDSQFFIDEQDEKKIQQARESINAVLNVRFLNFTEKKNDPGFNSIFIDMESDETLGTVFPVLFVTIALLGIMTTMTRLIARQRTTIGTLKAIGFSQFTVTVHYMSYSVVIALLGCIAGAIAGWFTLGKYLFKVMGQYYSNPYARMEFSPRILIGILIICAMAALTNYLSCKKLLSRHASEILRPEAPTVSGAGFLEKTPLWNKLGFASRWNLRDINRNKVRTVAAFLGTGLCAALLLTAFGIDELQKNVENWEFGELMPAAYSVGFAEGTDYSTVYDYARQYSGQMTQQERTEIYGRNGFSLLNVLVIDEGNLYFFQDKDGNYIELPDNGIAISYKAAEALDVKMGDFVSFKMPRYTSLFSARIVKMYKNPTAQGIAMSKEFYESLGARFMPTTLYTNMTVPGNLVGDRPEVTSVFEKKAFIDSLHAHQAAMDEEVAYIMGIAVIIGIVVLYNLGVLSFVEKTREIATLKVLGFSTNKIRWILQQQNILITGLSTVTGLILGYRFLGTLMTELDADTDFIIHLSVRPFIYAFMISFVLSLIVNSLISSMVRVINMVEALKGVE